MKNNKKKTNPTKQNPNKKASQKVLNDFRRWLEWMEALILLNGDCWSDGPAQQTEAIGFCLDQTLGLQRKNPQYIHSAGLSYVNSFAGSLMFRTPVCSLKRGNYFIFFFKHFILSGTRQLLYYPKTSEEPMQTCKLSIPTRWTSWTLHTELGKGKARY